MQQDGWGESAGIAGGTCVVAVIAVVGASSTDSTGPILAFAGALIVAFIAAYTAKRRQDAALSAERDRLRIQLEHDSDRLTMQLEQESARLERQLAHERRLADVRDLRDALKEALDATDDVHDRAMEYLNSDEHSRDDELARADTRMHSALHALAIRLNRRDPLLETYLPLFKASLRMRDAARDSDRAQVDAAEKEWGRNYGVFVAQATRRVGVGPQGDDE